MTSIQKLVEAFQALDSHVDTGDMISQARGILKRSREMPLSQLTLVCGKFQELTNAKTEKMGEERIAVRFHLWAQNHPVLSTVLKVLTLGILVLVDRKGEARLETLEPSLLQNFNQVVHRRRDCIGEARTRILREAKESEGRKLFDEYVMGDILKVLREGKEGFDESEREILKGRFRGFVEEWHRYRCSGDLSLPPIYLQKDEITYFKQICAHLELDNFFREMKKLQEKERQGLINAFSIDAFGHLSGEEQRAFMGKSITLGGAPREICENIIEYYYSDRSSSPGKFGHDSPDASVLHRFLTRGMKNGRAACDAILRLWDRFSKEAKREVTMDLWERLFITRIDDGPWGFAASEEALEEFKGAISEMKAILEENYGDFDLRRFLSERSKRCFRNPNPPRKGTISSW